MSVSKQFTATLVLVAAVASAISVRAIACPFCSAVSQTFSEEMATMDVVVICELTKLGNYDPLNDDPQAEIPLSTFTIKRVIKGKEFAKEEGTFDSVYFGDEKKGRPFLAMATDAPNLQWSTPLILSDRAEAYLNKLDKLNTAEAGKLKDLQAKSDELAESLKKHKGEDQTSLVSDDYAVELKKKKELLDRELDTLKLQLGIDRLVFFQDYLEDEDEMLARDAYDEFAKAPYDQVQGLKSQMKHDKIVEFINNPEVPSNRRRLYFTMLGVCGTEADATMLEDFMASDDRKKKAGLDSLIACYLLLTGDDGLAKVDDRFLKDSDAEYADTYAAIMAIRFHGSEVDVIERTRLTESLRYMLDRPELADLVIPDLARWEDWSVIPKLVTLFAKADDNSSWVRVPVVNYLRACPLPIAEEKIELLKTIDAEAVERAMKFFPAPTEKSESNAKRSTKPTETNEANEATTTLSEDSNSSLQLTSSTAGMVQPLIGAEDATVAATTPVIDKSATASTDDDSQAISPQLTSAKDMKSAVSIAPPETLNEVESEMEKGPSFWALLGVTSVCALGCFGAMRVAIGQG